MPLSRISSVSVHSPADRDRTAWSKLSDEMPEAS
jgi:hypothetical protein